MSLTSPKLTMSKLLLAAVVDAVASGLSEADLLTSIMLELVKASLSQMEAMLSLDAQDSEDLVPVEFAATVPGLSVAKLPGELVASTTLVNNSAARVVNLVVALSAVVATLVLLVPLALLVLVPVASEVLASAVSSMLPPELLPNPAVRVLVYARPEVASLVVMKPGELAA